jgi:protein-histidine N-methyltransferase
VSFDSDAIISQMNEYEVLQLLMGDCREALAAYKTSLEEETKFLQVRCAVAAPIFFVVCTAKA